MEQSKVRALPKEQDKSRIKHTKRTRRGSGAEGASEKKARPVVAETKSGPVDYVFLMIVMVLLFIGIIMMFSASYVAGLSRPDHDGSHFVKIQVAAAVLGLIAMFIISCIDYHVLMNTKLIIVGYVGTLILMCLCFMPEPLGHAEAGAHRWINIFGQSFQPSELMKAVLVVFLANLICKNTDKLGNFRQGVIPLMAIMGIVCLMMVLQRHISGLAIMLVIGLCVIFVGGMPWKTFAQLVGILFAAALVFALLYSVIKGGGEGGGLDYVKERILGMSQAETEDGDNLAWQTRQSLIAIGSGGWFGLGFGQSRQKYAWLPESYNDFIIPIIIEELGYIGGLVIVILFGLFIYRGFYIAKKAHDKFGMLIVTGITFQIGVQAILNIGVACNAFPNTGISLPFFSSGGTALLMQLAEMGVILSVSKHSDI